MTTPCDDIAGLSEWLRVQSRDCNVPEEELEGARYLEAATQLDALSARVKELEAKPPLLDAQSLPRVDALIKTLEARAIRAEQERDEAYERAAEIALEYDDDVYENSDMNTARRQTAKIIARRLASGPEKEKK